MDGWKENICFFHRPKMFSQSETELLELSSILFQVFRLNTGECALKSFEQFFKSALPCGAGGDSKKEKERGKEFTSNYTCTFFELL